MTNKDGGTAWLCVCILIVYEVAFSKIECRKTEVCEEMGLYGLMGNRSKLKRQ